MDQKQSVIFKDLGPIPYADAWDLQTELCDRLKLWKRNNQTGSVREQPHYLLFCEHPPVYTLGRSGSELNLLADELERKAIRAEYFKINRGGDITYHGPGQIVGYPIFDLDRFFTDVHKYVRLLEEATIRLLETYGITGERVPKYTGVWISCGSQKRKICAIGVHLSRWVTMHGFALNVKTDLDYFSHIIPCGISAENTSVTSLQQELDREIGMEDVKVRLKTIFAELFDFTYLQNDI